MWTFFYFVIMRIGLHVGRFFPKKYTREVIENSDLRKFDDFLRMVLDCSPDLAAKIENCLKAAAAKGVARYGLHLQQAAMMTYFTPSWGTGRLCVCRRSSQAGDPRVICSGPTGGWLLVNGWTKQESQRMLISALASRAALGI